jgi:stage III sporulation protein AF
VLREWVRNILLLVMFAGFLELLLPSNNMKRFVQVAVGLFILATILGPMALLLNFLSTEPRMELPVFSWAETQEVLRAGEELAARQHSEVLEKYRQSLARQVESLIKLSGQGEIVEVEVEIEEAPSEPTFGQIRSLSVELASMENGSNRSIEELADLLADFYGLSREKVRVQKVHQGG